MILGDVLRYSPYYSMFFIWFVGSGAQVLARPLFAYQLGASPFLVVLITASNGLSYLVASPLTGFLSDRFGRRPLLAAGTAIRAVTVFGQFFAESYWTFFALEFIGGMGVSMFNTSSTIVMADLTTVENRGRLLAVRQITSRVGNLLGPAGAALVLIAFNGDLRYIFLINAVSKVIVFFLVLYLAKETAPEENRKPRNANAAPQAKMDFSFFMTKAFFALFITTLSLNMMGQQGAFGALFPVQAQELGISAAELGQLLSLAGFIGLIVTYPNGWAVDRWGRKLTLVPGLLLLAVAALILANLDSRTQIYAVIVLFGVGQAVSMGASQAFAADLAPAERRGTFLGVWNTTSNAGSIIAPLIIGAVASTLGFAPGYIAVAIFLTLSAVFMAVFGPETGRRRAARAAAEAAAAR